MDTPVLVTEHIEVGRRILEELDGQKLPVVAAFWYRRSEEGMWRFAVATPRLEQDPSFATYRAINEAVAHVPRPPSLRSFDIQVFGARDRMVTDFRAFAGTDAAPFIGGRWTGGRIGEQSFDEIYLYRAERLVPESGTVPVRFAVRDKAAKRWVMSSGSLTYTAGQLTALTSEPGATRTRQRKNGLSAKFTTVDGVASKKRQQFGYLREWQYSDGRLESLRETAHPVPVVDAPSTSPA